MSTELLVAGLSLAVVALVGVLVLKGRRVRADVFDLAESPQSGPRVSGGLAHTESSPEEIILGPADNPRVSLRLAQPADLSLRREPMKLPAPILEGLAPLLQQVPRVLVEGVNAGANVWRTVLHFSPETWKGIADGSLELMNSAKMGGAFRGMARSARTKEIVEHANITFEVSPVTVAVAIWQIAALITAQKFLSDINARLARLERGLASIRGFLDDQATGTLEGNVAYLRDRAETLGEGRLVPAELLNIGNQLEEIDRESRAAASLMMKQLARATEEIKSAKWDALWSAEEEAGEARSQINRASQVATAFLVANHVRLITASLRGAMGLNQAYSERSLQSIREEIAKEDNEWLRLKSTVEAKLPTLKASLQRDGTDHRQQETVAVILGEATAHRRQKLDQLLLSTEELTEALLANNRAADLPMQLELEINDRGEVISSNRLLAS
ncbi:MAG: hypothetical protein R3B89_21060 [Polyangiaceae bacterium]